MFPENTGILIADDMLKMRQLIQNGCRELGFKKFFIVSDGVEAWDTLNQHPGEIDLIISDWNMPNLTGLTLLKQVRAQDDLAHIPFVLLTAESEASQVAEAVEAGVDNFIVKPFSVVTLEKKLLQTYKSNLRKRSA